MTWQQWLPALLGSIFTAALLMIGNVAVKRMSKPVDDATALGLTATAQATTLKTSVEVDKVRAETEQLRVKTAEENVGIARALLGDVRIELERQRGEVERLRKETDERYADVCNSLADVKDIQKRLMARQKLHVPWDRKVYKHMLETDPNFPEPPPLGIED